LCKFSENEFIAKVMLLGLIYYHYPEKSTFLCVCWCHRKKKL